MKKSAAVSPRVMEYSRDLLKHFSEVDVPEPQLRKYTEALMLGYIRAVDAAVQNHIVTTTLKPTGKKGGGEVRGWGQSVGGGRHEPPEQVEEYFPVEYPNEFAVRAPVQISTLYWLQSFALEAPRHPIPRIRTSAEEHLTFGRWLRALNRDVWFTKFLHQVAAAKVDAIRSEEEDGFVEQGVEMASELADTGPVPTVTWTGSSGDVFFEMGDLELSIGGAHFPLAWRVVVDLGDGEGELVASDDYDPSFEDEERARIRLRRQAIRLASRFPAGDPARRALLETLREG